MPPKFFLYLLIPLTTYLFLLLATHPQIFSYTYPPTITETYLRSQDIFDYTGNRRVILSDSEIHMASGLLYAQGADPSYYNFQHPPLIKYLFGFSILLFNNPFIIQILFGLGLIAFTFTLSYRLFHHLPSATMASMLLAIDPLLLDLSSQALLDLGLAFFCLAYIHDLIFKPKNFIAHGTVLGLIALSKFWAVALFFFIFPQLYKLISRQKINLLFILKSLCVTALVFLLGYTASFITHRGLFNLPFAQLKILKYWLHHSSASLLGNSLLLFLTGHFYNWWSQPPFSLAQPWSLIWPLSLITTLLQIRPRPYFSPSKFPLYLPLAYLLYLSLQAPFPRYFILIIPFLYIFLAKTLMDLFGKQPMVRLPLKKS